MAGEMLYMNILDINKHRCQLKNLCFKTIYLTLHEIEKIINVEEQKKNFNNT